MAEFAGRRREDMQHAELPDDIRAGDYWKLLNDDGSEVHTDWPNKLSRGDWMVVAPMPGGGFAIGALCHHTVREHEDGTISVRPGDGSSNSILLRRGAHGPEFHGYIEHGVWRDA